MSDPDIDIGEKPSPQISFRLWSVNRWLRWTGVRLFISYDPNGKDPSRIGLAWWGWP
jgi:hypothetical protein